MNNVTKFATTEPMRPRDYAPAQLALIRKTVAADCNPDEFDLFIEVCKRVGLDPFRRQIYAVVYNKNNPEKRKMSIITGIDGFRAVAARNLDYRPDENEPEIEYREELKDPMKNPLGINKAVVRCFKLAPDGRWFPVVGVAYWEEFAPLSEVWEMSQEEKRRVPTGRFELDKRSKWYTMPRVMLPKCAEAQAIRKGWPEDLSGVYAPEEVAREVEDVSASQAVEVHETEERLKLINAVKAVPIQWEMGKPIEHVPIGAMADRAMAHIQNATDLVQLEAWRDTNAIGLREFWALSKNDALEVKRQLEKRLSELRKQPNTILGAG